MWQTIISIVKFLLQLIVVGIVILIINVLPDGAKDIVTTISFIIAFFLIYLFFAKQIDDLDYRVAGLELQIEETKEKFEGWKNAHWKLTSLMGDIIRLNNLSTEEKNYDDT